MKFGTEDKHCYLYLGSTGSGISHHRPVICKRGGGKFYLPVSCDGTLFTNFEGATLADMSTSQTGVSWFEYLPDAANMKGYNIRYVERSTGNPSESSPTVPYNFGTLFGRAYTWEHHNSYALDDVQLTGSKPIAMTPFSGSLTVNGVYKGYTNGFAKPSGKTLAKFSVYVLISKRTATVLPFNDVDVRIALVRSDGTDQVVTLSKRNIDGAIVFTYDLTDSSVVYVSMPVIGDTSASITAGRYLNVCLAYGFEST